VPAAEAAGPGYHLDGAPSKLVSIGWGERHNLWSMLHNVCNLLQQRLVCVLPAIVLKEGIFFDVRPFNVVLYLRICFCPTLKSEK